MLKIQQGLGMNYDGLEHRYWEDQARRIEDLRAKIAGRADASAAGRSVPDDQDLAIGTGRRMPLTVAFLDISGFSDRPSATAAEQEMMVRVLNLFLTAMIRIASDYGGSVEKNTGDGLMLYFDDSAQGNANASSTKRAVACCLSMFATNEYLIKPVLRASDVVPIDFRMTMDYGPITIARLGTAGGFNANAAIGNVANFASHMLGNVKANEIGIGAAARSRLPFSWQIAWTELSPVSTGWQYIESKLPYPLYIYTGRWSRLI